MWKWKINEEDCHVSQKWDRILTSGNEECSCVFKTPATCLLVSLAPGLYSLTFLACLPEVFEFISLFPNVSALIALSLEVGSGGVGGTKAAIFIFHPWKVTLLTATCLIDFIFPSGGVCLFWSQALGYLFHTITSLPLPNGMQGSVPSGDWQEPSPSPSSPPTVSGILWPSGPGRPCLDSQHSKWSVPVSCGSWAVGEVCPG